MGSTFVDINDFGFWAHDSLLELWLQLVALHLSEPTDSDSPDAHATVKKIRDQWLVASKGYFGGCIPVSLDEAVATKEGRIRVRSPQNLCWTPWPPRQTFFLDASSIYWALQRAATHSTLTRIGSSMLAKRF